MTRWKTLAVVGGMLLITQQGIAQRRPWPADDEFKTKSFSDLAVSPVAIFSCSSCLKAIWQRACDIPALGRYRPVEDGRQLNKLLGLHRH